MTDYQSFHDKMLAEFLENAHLNARQVRYAMEYTEKLKAEDAEIIKASVKETEQRISENAAKAAERAAEAKGRLVELNEKLRRREISPSKAAREIAATGREIEALRAAAAKYEQEAVRSAEQLADPLRYADAIFENAPSLQADRPSVRELGSNF